MARRTLFEQLDEAVQAVLSAPDALLPRLNPRLAPPLRIAVALRDLPRANFKSRLRAELQRRATMSASAVKPIREGFHTITPYLAVREAPEVVEFTKRAFGAVELLRGTGSQGGLHAEVRIGDSMVMIGGGGAWQGTPTPTALHMYVEDADALYHRAVEAGGVSMYAPVDQDYGDREAAVKDAAGNLWYIATRREGGFRPAGMHTVTPYLHPLRAEPLMNFLKRAFHAEELERYSSPDGVINHAKLRVGSSMLEMGEAHGPFQPMPTTFFFYTDDVDAVYRRALEAGATSVEAPSDQPYGDRVGAVADSFGNKWYIATHVRDVTP